MSPPPTRITRNKQEIIRCARAHTEPTTDRTFQNVQEQLQLVVVAEAHGCIDQVVGRLDGEIVGAKAPAQKVVKGVLEGGLRAERARLAVTIQRERESKG